MYLFCNVLPRHYVQYFVWFEWQISKWNNLPRHTWCKVNYNPEHFGFDHGFEVFIFIAITTYYQTPLQWIIYIYICWWQMLNRKSHVLTRRNSCRPLEEGDIVNVDVTVYLNGCHGKVSDRCGWSLCDQQILLMAVFSEIISYPLWCSLSCVLFYIFTSFFLSLDQNKLHVFSPASYNSVTETERAWWVNRRFERNFLCGESR